MNLNEFTWSMILNEQSRYPDPYPTDLSGRGPHPDVPTWTFGTGMWLESRGNDALRHGRWSLPADARRVHAELIRLGPAVDRDTSLRQASKRWQPGRPDPVGYVAGDVPAVRSMIGNAIFTVCANDTRVFVDWDEDTTIGAAMQTSMLRALYAAEPHWIPTRLVHAIATSAPPTDSDRLGIRLGYTANLVLFGDDIPIDRGVWADMEILEPTFRRDHPLGASSILHRLFHYGGGVCGMILFADEDGRPRDDIMWVFCGNEDPEGLVPDDKIRALMWGWRSRCTANTQALIDNVAAYLAWGDWNQPRAVTLPAPTSREWRHAVRTSQFRKNEPNGGVAGVRVAALKRPGPSTRTEEPVGTHRSPSPHHRRGHWRNQAVGSRGDGAHELRWIAPTWVNPGGGEPDVRVWTISR